MVEIVVRLFYRAARLRRLDLQRVRPAIDIETQASHRLSRKDVMVPKERGVDRVRHEPKERGPNRVWHEKNVLESEQMRRTLVEGKCGGACSP